MLTITMYTVTILLIALTIYCRKKLIKSIESRDHIYSAIIVSFMITTYILYLFFIFMYYTLKY